MVKTHPLFARHERTWRSNRYVYPVISRRSGGLSIGINLSPDNACNFHCAYCCVDRMHALDRNPVDVDVLREELDHMLAAFSSGALFCAPPFDDTPAELRRLNDVAFSGNGEPTASPHFHRVARLAAKLIHEHGLRDTKIVVITNATLLHRPRVMRTLEFLDRHNGEIWAKLDGGTAEVYQRINRSRIPFGRVLSNIVKTARVRPIVIQSMFARLHDAAPAEGEIAAYLERLKEVLDAGGRIKSVQVYTVARNVAEHYVSPLAEDLLAAIAARVRALGIAAQAYC
ncbi:MAG TPA: hypothetical protein VIL86_17885 [Tepidisphaeraceae bacterium]|jgi:wyosine [tRNA(Phe)-imidazoG37] synthetase (radical SAM superfamily)